MRISELTIGSHVDFENKVYEVMEIVNGDYAPYIALKAPREDSTYVSNMHPDLEPIAIIPQYLTDNGFKHTPPLSGFSNNKYGSYEREIGDAWIMVTHLGNDYWEVYLNRRETHLGRCRYIKYWHQMEVFLNIHEVTL